MATEQEYDEIIAPMLAEVASRCKELGMDLIARVEWEPGESGITQIGIGGSSGIGQKMTQLAAHCHGNFDLLCIEAGKRFDLSQTVYKAAVDRMST
ncbi:hypothetical protein [Leisingera sp. M523]|uniref:hypothetical protein n=1 Tax=Leisingera sp. M523 TaxID=2867013 RepID=UPI0021A46CAE|nr:hypothetical protein [Leisingera sp. M523]UWQ29925.1 hypothetical protein K3557_05085 [Leisingera sp. M523]